MGGSCCGGSCGSRKTPANGFPGEKPGHADIQKSARGGKPGVAIMTTVAVCAIAGVAVIAAISLAQPTSPVAPPAPVPAKQPDSPSAPTTPRESKSKAYDPAADGVIRHGRAEPIAKPDGCVRIATYNVENFFDKESSAGSTGAPTPAKPVEHRKAVAAAIHAINADVLALEEIESKETITRFRDEYLADMGYTSIASIDAGDPRGIEQSILSRFPLKDEMNWPAVPLVGAHPDKLGTKRNPDAGKPLILHRSPMRATVDISGPVAGLPKDHAPIEITLFAVHHKSGAYYGYEREAEGVKVLELVHDFEKQHPGAAVIVLGDFNARTTEKSFQIYTAGGMVDAMTGVPGGVESKEFLSHVSGRTIDHMVLNPPAAAMVSLDTRFVLGTKQRPENVDWRNTDPPSGYGSDHYPVIVDFVLGETPGSPVKHGLPSPKISTAHDQEQVSPSPAPPTDRK